MASEFNSYQPSETAGFRITPAHAELIRSSYIVLEPQARRLVELFHENLFITSPEVHDLFISDDDRAHENLRDALALIVFHVERLEELERVLVDMGVRVAKRGFEPAHYPIVRDVLIQSLAQVADDLWYSALDEAWTVALELVSRIMIGAGDDLAKPQRQAA